MFELPKIQQQFMGAKTGGLRSWLRVLTIKEAITTIKHDLTGVTVL